MTIDNETKSKVISYAVLIVLFLASAAFAVRYEPTRTRPVKKQINSQQKVSADSNEQKTPVQTGDENF